MMHDLLVVPKTGPTAMVVPEMMTTPQMVPLVMVPLMVTMVVTVASKKRGLARPHLKMTVAEMVTKALQTAAMEEM